MGGLRRMLLGRVHFFVMKSLGCGSSSSISAISVHLFLSSFSSSSKLITFLECKAVVFSEFS